MRIRAARTLSIVCMLAIALAAAPAAASALTVLGPGSPNTISGLVSDVDGVPLADVVVESFLWDSQASVWKDGPVVETRANGTYLLNVRSSGAYRVAFLHGGFLADGLLGLGFLHVPQFYNGRNMSSQEFLASFIGQGLPSGLDTVTVPAGAPGPTGIDASLTLSPVSIEGHVRDTAGDPADHVNVTLYARPALGMMSLGGWMPVMQVAVDADGGYAFRGLYGGIYRVGFSSDASGTWVPTFYPQSNRLLTAANLEAGPTPISGIDATLAGASVNVTGTVRDLTSRASLAGVRVSARRYEHGLQLPTAVAETSTTALGTYELSGLIPGERYTLIALDGKRLHSYSSRELTASAGIARMDLSMPRIPLVRFFDASVGKEEAALRDARFNSNYRDVLDVVLIPADWAAMPQTCGAPTLAWAYQVRKAGSVNRGKNAPIVSMYRSGSLSQLQSLVTTIALNNGRSDHRVIVHVAGTLSSVPQARLNALRSYATSAGANVTFDRLVTSASADRYDVAIAIAKRARGRALLDPADALAVPRVAFLGRGDTLSMMAATPVAAYRGAVVLPLPKGSVPARIKAALKYLGIAGSSRYLLGPSSVVTKAQATALAVPDRNRLYKGDYSTVSGTCAGVTAAAVAKRWLSVTAPAAAVSYPWDMIVAGSAVGDSGGAMLYVDGGGLGYLWLASHARVLPAVWAVGHIGLRYRLDILFDSGDPDSNLSDYYDSVLIGKRALMRPWSSPQVRATAAALRAAGSTR